MNRADGAGLVPNLVDGGSRVTGVAVDGGFVYWTNASSDSIGRASADGTGFQQAFVPNVFTPLGLAIDVAGGPPAPPFTGSPPPLAPKLAPQFQGGVESSNALELWRQLGRQRWRRSGERWRGRSAGDDDRQAERREDVGDEGLLEAGPVGAGAPDPSPSSRS